MRMSSKLSLRNLLHIGAAISLFAIVSPASAQIINGSAGLTSPATTITFDEVVVANGTQITNQYTPYGLTFTGSYDSPSFYDGFNLPNINGNFVTNFPTSRNPLSTIDIFFSTTQSQVAFNLISDATTVFFQALLGGISVQSFSGAGGFSGTNNYFGFNGVSFDQIRVSSSSGGLGLDNLQIGSVAGAVPEPATWAMMLIGFGGMGVALRRRRRQTNTLFQAA